MFHCSSRLIEYFACIHALLHCFVLFVNARFADLLLTFSLVCLDMPRLACSLRSLACLRACSLACSPVIGLSLVWRSCLLALF